jgi:HPt (histidine-containing phosphotransfer) domain-containing protein
MFAIFARFNNSSIDNRPILLGPRANACTSATTIARAEVRRSAKVSPPKSIAARLKPLFNCSNVREYCESARPIPQVGQVFILAIAVVTYAARDISVSQVTEAAGRCGNQVGNASLVLEGFDPVRFAWLEQALGDMKMRQLLVTARADVASSLAQIRECAARHDVVALGAAAHALFGAAGNIGASQIQDRAARLRASARDGEDTSALLSELEAAVGVFEANINHLAPPDP